MERIGQSVEHWTNRSFRTVRSNSINDSMAPITPTTSHGEAGSPTPSGADRRIHPRICTPPLYVSNGSVEDISLGGIRVHYSAPLFIGQRENLILTDAFYHFTAELPAEVVWQRDGIAGFRWLPLSPGEEKWLNERFAAWDPSSPLDPRGGADPAGSSAPDAERRQYERIQDPPLQVSYIRARVRDISLGGICLVMEAGAAHQDRYELFLTDGLYYFAEQLSAELVWQRGNVIGLRWVNPGKAQQERLKQYFEHWRTTSIDLLVRSKERSRPR